VGANGAIAATHFKSQSGKPPFQIIQIRRFLASKTLICRYALYVPAKLLPTLPEALSISRIKPFLANDVPPDP